MYTFCCFLTDVYKFYGFYWQNVGLLYQFVLIGVLVGFDILFA
jgi:hypothetical protein